MESAFLQILRCSCCCSLLLRATGAAADRCWLLLLDERACRNCKSADNQPHHCNVRYILALHRSRIAADGCACAWPSWIFLHGSFFGLERPRLFLLACSASLIVFFPRALRCFRSPFALDFCASGGPESSSGANHGRRNRLRTQRPPEEPISLRLIISHY